MALTARMLIGLLFIGLLQHALVVAASQSDMASSRLGSTKDGALGSLGASNLLRFNAARINDYGDAGTWMLEVGPSPAGVTILPQSKKLKNAVASSLKCINSKRIFDRDWRQYVTNSFRHTPFEARGDQCGFGSSCGRHVVDGAFMEEDLLEVEEEGVKQWSGIELLKDLVGKSFGIPAGRLRAVGGQVDINVLAASPCQLHADFLSNPGFYFYTAIVYLSNQQPGGCGSCETVFVDAVDSLTGDLARGLVVQPRRGRIALFSGGAENMHCKVPSTGDRRVVQVFFQCISAAEL